MTFWIPAVFFLFVFFVKGQLCGLCDTDGLQSSGVQSNCSCKADFFIVTKTFMCKESIPVFLFVCFFKEYFCHTLCSPARQLSNLDSFQSVHSPYCNILCMCVCVCACRRAYASCRSHVLYSLCYAEYWLGGRWLNSSCLALLMWFIFLYFLFIYSHLFIC